MKTFKTLAAMGILLLAAATYMPTVSAHECMAEANTTGEADCSAPCKDGEDHEHKVTHHHENGLGQDESHVHYSCTSQREDAQDPPPKCSSPRVLGFCLISQDGVDALLAKAAAIQECAAESIGLGDPIPVGATPATDVPDPDNLVGWLLAFADSLVQVQNCG